MSLKLIFFPFSVVLFLAITLGFTVPEFQDAQAQIVTNTKHQAELDNAILKNQNINSLTSSLNTEPLLENLSYDFLPFEKEEEQFVNQVSSVALSSNVQIIEGTFTPVQKKVEPVIDSTEGGNKNASDFETRSITSEFRVTGSFSSIQLFLDRLYQMGRFHELHNLIIKHVAIQSADGSPVLNDFLTADIMLDFGYVEHAKIGQSELDISLFSQSTLDFTSLGDLNRIKYSGVPLLQASSTDTRNPFVK